MFNKLKKLLILGLLGLILSNSLLFDISVNTPRVYAATTGVNPDDKSATPASEGGTEANQNMKNFAEFLSNANQVLYVLMWPMLALAGVSMDNQFVYGSAFKLDTALWKFWVMTRTFSNYVLGFFFIISIFLYFFKFKENNNDPRKLIPKILVAAILIQASWFLLGAMVDISTIATYALGALPIKAVQSSDLGKKPLIIPNVTIDISNNGQLSKDSFNMATFVGGKASSPTKYGMCDYKDGTFKKMENAESDVDGRYCVYSHPKYNWILVEMGSKKETVDKDPEAKSKSDTALKGNRGDGDTLSLQNIIKFGKGMTGPFYALYTSIMNMISITASNKSAGSLTLEFLIKSLVTFALLVPLFALAVVMVIRIVVMWLYIGFSPLIALQAALDFKGIKNDKMGSKFEFGTVLGMVFMPVTAVFALSISIIFLSALLDGPVNKSDNDNGVWTAMGVKIDTEEGNPGKTCMTIDKLNAQLCVANKENDLSISNFFNMFSRIMINLFGIALMRTVVFAALKTSKITKGVVDKIEGFAEGIVQSTPFIPIPGVGTVGVGALKQGMGTLQGMPQVLQNNNYNETLDKLFHPSKDKGENGSKGSEFDKAMNKAGRGGMTSHGNEILEGFNKTHPSAKAGSLDEMLDKKEFREYLAGNKDKLDVLDEGTMTKFAEQILKNNEFKSLRGKTSDIKFQYMPSEKMMYEIKGGSKKTVTMINFASPSQDDLKKFVENLATDTKKEDFTSIGINPEEIVSGTQKYKIEFGTGGPKLENK